MAGREGIGAREATTQARVMKRQVGPIVSHTSAMANSSAYTPSFSLAADADPGRLFSSAMAAEGAG